MFFKKFFKKLYQILIIPKTKGELSRLRRNPNPSFKSLAIAIEGTWKNTLTPEEKIQVERIETIREKLNACSTEILMIDYGAQSSDTGLSEGQAYEGSVKKSTIGNICKCASKSRFWSLLLFKIIREFKPSICLELGTCLGISASYQAVALKLNKLGKMVTIEGDKSLVSIARDNFSKLGLDNIIAVAGRFQDILGGLLDELRPIDYVFIDGHHDGKATLAYFEQIFPFLSDRAALVFDDICWSQGMKRAWCALKTDKRIRISVDLHNIGICVIDNNVKEKQNFTIRIIG